MANKSKIILATKSARGEKARAKLMKAALVIMERVGYHKMRISDVTDEAGVVPNNTLRPGVPRNSHNKPRPERMPGMAPVPHIIQSRSMRPGRRVRTRI